MNTCKTTPLSPLWPTPSASLESAERKIGNAAAHGADEKSFRKSAHIGEVDVNACSSSNTKPESRK